MSRELSGKIQKNQLQGEQLRVLIVDDEPALRRSIQSVLTASGLESDTASGGYAAIEALEKYHYPLVLLDLNMPDLDGSQVLDHINQQGIDSHVIVLTGETEINKAIKVLKNGAKDYLRKPYTVDELMFSINNVLDKIRLEADYRDMVTRLEESEALHRFIVHNSPDLLYMLDRKGHFVFVNKNTVRRLKYSRKELIGKHYSEIVHPLDKKRAELYFDRGQIKKNIPRNLEIRLRGRGGAILHVEVRAINIEKKIDGGYKLGRYDSNEPSFIGSYGIARDISERKRSEEIIRYQYNHDLLTGLPNRTLLYERLSGLVQQAKNKDMQIAVLFIDINRFKLINDTYGQNLGDALLQELAETLGRCIREGDTLARLGGDEFVLLLPDIDDQQDAIAVANKIVTEAALPVHQNGHEVYLSVSVGIALYPEHGTTAEDLIRKADVAAANAKSKSESHFYLYHNKLYNRSSTKVFTEKLIRDACLNNRFVVYYQPQIDLQSSALHAIEALVRIQSPKGKLIPPGKFIEIAEETTLINDIGNIVIDQTCHDARIWHDQGFQVPISINISAGQLSDRFFSEQVLEKINSYGLDPAFFEIEVTENVLVQNMTRAITNLLELTNEGMRIAIDDFGIGYSSLSYLDRLPLHTLKLDKSFLRKIDEGNQNDSIIPAMIQVARGLQLDFIAEGVETQIQHQYLLEQGAAIAQGYYYAMPLEKKALLAFVERHQLHIKHQSPGRNQGFGVQTVGPPAISSLASYPHGNRPN